MILCNELQLLLDAKYSSSDDYTWYDFAQP